MNIFLATVCLRTISQQQCWILQHGKSLTWLKNMNAQSVLNVMQQKHCINNRKKHLSIEFSLCVSCKDKTVNTITVARFTNKWRFFSVNQQYTASPVLVCLTNVSKEWGLFWSIKNIQHTQNDLQNDPASFWKWTNDSYETVLFSESKQTVWPA